MSCSGLALVALVAVATPSPAPNPHLVTARAQVDRLEEEAALATLEKARRWPYNTPEELAQVNFLCALAHAGLANEAKAVEYFRLARKLDPSLQLSKSASPNVAAWWARAAPPPTDTPARSQLTPPVQLQPEAWTHSAPAQSRGRWNRWLGGGLAVAGAGAGATGLWFGSRSRQQEARSRSEERIDVAQAAYAQAGRDARVANTLFVGAGVALAAGVVLWLLPTSDGAR